jgi:hypothetical protein
VWGRKMPSIVISWAARPSDDDGRLCYPFTALSLTGQLVTNPAEFSGVARCIRSNVGICRQAEWHSVRVARRGPARAHAPVPASMTRCAQAMRQAGRQSCARGWYGPRHG